MEGRHGCVAALAVVALTLTGTGRADAENDHREVAPLKGWSRAISFHGGGHSIGGVRAGGLGVDFELARGRGRWQLLGDAAVRWVSLSVYGPPLGSPPMTPIPEGPDGIEGRLGLGARWIARSFEPDHSAAIELFLEGSAGLERTWWNGGGVLTRPDLMVGGGWQIRGLQWPRIMMRITVKALVQAPVGDDVMRAVCRGSCPSAGRPGTDGGFIGQLGVAW